MASKSGTDSETATGFLVFLVPKGGICIGPTLCWSVGTINKTFLRSGDILIQPEGICNTIRNV